MRSEFSAEKDARDREMMKESSRNINLIEDDEEEEDVVEDKDEEVYYFDLVQVMSLLLIPELVQFADKHENNTNFLTTDGKAKISLESDEVVKLVIDTLTEIFDEDLQRDLRNGGHLDVGILQQILLAFGDVDSANNPRLLKEMLVSYLRLYIISYDTVCMFV